MSTKELAAALGVGAATIARLRAEGLIHYFHIRTRIRYEYEEVLDDLQRGESQHGLRKITAIIKTGGPRRPEKSPSIRARPPVILTPYEERNELAKGKRDDDDEYDRDESNAREVAGVSRGEKEDVLR